MDIKNVSRRMPYKGGCACINSDKSKFLGFKIKNRANNL